MKIRFFWMLLVLLAAGTRSVANERATVIVVAGAPGEDEYATVFAHLGQFAFEPGDAVLHAAAVDLELGFAGTAGADAAALALQMRPTAYQSGT